MSRLSSLAFIMLIALFAAFAPSGYDKIKKFENEQDEQLCLYGTACWNALSFEEKLKIQKVWRHGGSRDDEPA